MDEDEIDLRERSSTPRRATHDAPTVVVVDDDPATCDYLRISLTLEGWEVVVAGSCDEAIGHLEVVEPDAVVLDHEMPGTTGLECVKRIRLLGSRTALVVFSGSIDPSLAISLRELGVPAIEKADRAALFELLADVLADARAARAGDRATGS